MKKIIINPNLIATITELKAKGLPEELFTQEHLAQNAGYAYKAITPQDLKESKGAKKGAPEKSEVVKTDGPTAIQGNDDVLNPDKR